MKHLLGTISLLLFAFIFGFIGFILGTTGFPQNSILLMSQALVQ